MSTHRESDVAEKQLAVSLFAALFSVACAVLFILCKIGFLGNVLNLVIDSLGLSFFILFFPNVVGYIIERKTHRSLAEKPWYLSYSALTLLGLFLVFVMGMLVSSGINPVPFLAVPGFLFMLIGLMLYFRKSRLQDNWPLAITATLVAVWISAHIYSNRFNLPLFVEYLAIGKTHIDTLFHAAVANMLKIHNYPSSGLDGIPLLNYHFGSHWFFGQIANLLNTHMIEVYLLAYPIIFIPLFLKSILMFGIELEQRLKSCAKLKRSLGSNWLFWLVLLVGLIGFLPTVAQSKLLLNLMLPFGSQSYTLSLTFAFLLLSLWCQNLSLVNESCATYRRHHWTFLFLAFPFLLAVIGFTKISVLMVFLALFGYFFFRLQLFKNMAFNALLAVLLLVFWRVYQFSNSSGGDIIFEPFNFFNETMGSTKPWFPAFLVFYYLTTYLYTALVIRQSGVRNLSQFAQALARREFIPLEMLWVTGLISLLPVNLIAMYGRAEFYFVDVQVWLALAVLLASLSSFTEHFQLLSFESVSWRRAMVFALLTVLAGFVVLEKADSAYHEISMIRQDIVSGMNHPSGKIQQNMNLLNELLRLDQLPLPQKREIMVFIPKSFRTYWDLLDRDANKLACQAAPYVAPAFSSLAMIDGLPDTGCELKELRFEAYTPRAHPQQPDETKAEYLCPQVMAKGFSKLIIISGTRSQLTTTWVQCQNASRKVVAP